MKKKALLAGIMALSLAMTACNNVKETEKKKSKKSKKTEKEVTDITDETDPDESSDKAISSDFDPSSDPQNTKPVPQIVSDLDENLFNYYASDAFDAPHGLVIYLSALTSWETTVYFDPEDNSFEGTYESAILNLDGDGYDMLQCAFNGQIDGFTRINEYSFHTHVTSLETEKFDKKTDRYMDLPAEVSYSDPYGFTDPDELILFLPNTPVTEIPEEAIEWIEMYQFIDPNGYLTEDQDAYLGSFILYNTAEGTAFMVLYSAIPLTREVTDADMSYWDGTYTDDHEGVKITIDKSSGEPTATIVRADSEYKDMHIRAVEDKEGLLILYGTNEAGNTVIAEFGTLDQRATLVIYESTDSLFPVGKFFYPKKG